jgi:hypothetical protein
VFYAEQLVELGIHKQIANRLLEPFAHMTTIVSATDWENFFALRAHPDAQPEFQALADLMLEVYVGSEPKGLRAGEWHLPFADKYVEDGLSQEQLVKITTARCARVSYLNFEGDISYEKDYKLHDDLLASGHMSPFEHAAIRPQQAGAVRELRRLLPVPQDATQREPGRATCLFPAQGTEGCEAHEHHLEALERPGRPPPQGQGSRAVRARGGRVRPRLRDRPRHLRGGRPAEPVRGGVTGRVQGADSGRADWPGAHPGGQPAEFALQLLDGAHDVPADRQPRGRHRGGGRGRDARRVHPVPVPGGRGPGVRRQEGAEGHRARVRAAGPCHARGYSPARRRSGPSWAGRPSRGKK